MPLFLKKSIINLILYACWKVVRRLCFQYCYSYNFRLKKLYDVLILKTQLQLKKIVFSSYYLSIVYKRNIKVFIFCFSSYFKLHSVHLFVCFHFNAIVDMILFYGKCLAILYLKTKYFVYCVQKQGLVQP